MGATTLGVLPAQAVDYENLELTIAEDDTNGVLATTMENGFQLELEWDVANVSDLAYLKYELTFESSDGSDIDSKGAVSGISWDAEEDSIDENLEFDIWIDGAIEDGEDFILEAPAHIIGEDDIALYRATVTDRNSSGVFCDTSSTDSYLDFASVTDDNTVTGDYCGDLSGTRTTVYTKLGGFQGPLNEAAPVSFESLVSIYYVDSIDDYVDVTVSAWTDKDGDGVKDSTESYAGSKVIRFWNPTALTPEIEVENPVWVDTMEDVVSAEVVTYITQELNEYYTEDRTYVNEDFIVYSDRNYNATRDGYVYPEDTFDSALVNDFAFNSEEFSGKHLFAVDSVLVDADEVSRVGLIDVTSTETDTYFDNVSDNVHEIVAGPVRIQFQLRTVDYVEGLLVEQARAFRGYAEDEDTSSANWRSGDAYIHESVTSVQYVVSLYSDGGEDADTTVSGVETTVYGYMNDDEDYGTVTINGTTVPMTGEDAGYFEIDATSNAAGQVVLNISVQNPDSSFFVDIYDITLQGAEFDVDYYEDNNAYLEWQQSSWNLNDELDHNSYQHVSVGSSVTLGYTVRDQWKTIPANNAARVILTFYGESFLGGDRDYAGTFGDTVNVTNGNASFTIPDVNPAAGEGSVEVEATLWVKDDLGGWTVPIDGNETTLDYLEDAAVATIDQTDSSESAEIAYGDFINIDSELTRWTKTIDDAYDVLDEDFSYGNFYGYVRNAEGHELAGQKITFSGSGLQFSNDEDNWATNSLTVFTDSEGYYDVYVWGQVVGEHTVTISVGGKSTTATFEVTNENVRAHNVAITSAFAGKAGTADTLTALVTDRYGNTMTAGETVTFSKVAGSGYIQETNGTVTTDEDGVATATLIIMSGEVGFNSTVRAAITQDDFAATSNSAAAQRSAGDTNVGKTTAWTKLQADGTAKMYAKNIVGAGKVQFFHNNKEIAWVRAADALNPKLRAANGAFYLVRTVELVDGKNVLEVYIDGERVRRTAYSK
jgi:hypothetical protein